jgi:hypothetical protein
MYRKLPAELRDLVYRFICIEDQPVPVGPYFHFRPYDRTHSKASAEGLASALSNGRVQIDHSERPDSAILMPNSHIFSTSFVAEEVVVELEEMYFASNTFSVCTVEDGVTEFLSGESTAVVPEAPNPSVCIPSMDTVDKTHRAARAFDLVRRLQIRIKYEHCDTVLGCSLPTDSTRAHEVFAREGKLLRTTSDHLRVLRHLPQREQPLEIEFIVMTALTPHRSMSPWLATHMQDERRRFINLLQALRNTFYALIHDRSDRVINIIHHDETLSPFPRNITALWSLTKDQWEHVRDVSSCQWLGGLFI